MTRRGVSEIVATLLMIAIVFSLGSFLYVFYSNHLQLNRAVYERTIDRYRKIMESDFGVTWYSYNSTSNTLTLYIYNYGDREVRLVRVYIDGNPYDINILINPDEILKLDLSISLQSGSHNIVLVSEEGFRSEIEIRT